MNTLACTQTKASIRDLRETGECNLFFECKNVVRKPSSTNPHKAKQRKWCTVDPYVWTMGGRLEAGWRRSCKDLHLFGQTGGRLEAGRISSRVTPAQPNSHESDSPSRISSRVIVGQHSSERISSRVTLGQHSPERISSRVTLGHHASERISSRVTLGHHSSERISA